MLRFLWNKYIHNQQDPQDKEAAVTICAVVVMHVEDSVRRQIWMPAACRRGKMWCAGVDAVKRLALRGGDVALVEGKDSAGGECEDLVDGDGNKDDVDHS
jgi:hypothetical protein